MSKTAAKWDAPTIHELPQPKGRDRAVDFAEEARYLAKASRNLRDATILTVDAGLRPDSELLTLLWDDVNLISRPESPYGVIHVRQGKTAKAVRSVPLTSRASEVFQHRKREAAASKKPSPFVFPGSGKARHIASLQHPHEKTIRDAKLKPFPLVTVRS